MRKIISFLSYENQLEQKHEHRSSLVTEDTHLVGEDRGRGGRHVLRTTVGRAGVVGMEPGPTREGPTRTVVSRGRDSVAPN